MVDNGESVSVALYRRIGVARSAPCFRSLLVIAMHLTSAPRLSPLNVTMIRVELHVILSPININDS